MKVILNGSQEELDGCLSLESIIADKGLSLNHLVVELNGQIVPAEDFKEVKVRENDVLEIISFVGGG